MQISRTIREQVTCQLRDEVIAGELGPGAVLRETELARRFGVSRGPIRDAFLQLSNEGFLSYEPNRGVTVRNPPDDSDREFIAELRRQIEIYVVSRGVEQLSEDALAKVRVALEALGDACRSNDLAAVKRCDLQFHEAVLSACSGESFLPAWKQLCSRMVLAYDRLGDINDIYTEHARILEALQSRNPVELTESLQRNIA